jgi:hypothetical protein
METESDLEVIEHLDFDPELVCEQKMSGSNCGKTAAWVVRTRCCIHSWLICEDHRLMWVQAAESAPYVRCSWCLVAGQVLSDVAEFIPIGGKP